MAGFDPDGHTARTGDHAHGVGPGRFPRGGRRHSPARNPRYKRGEIGVAQRFVFMPCTALTRIVAITQFAPRFEMLSNAVLGMVFPCSSKPIAPRGVSLNILLSSVSRATTSTAAGTTEASLSRLRYAQRGPDARLPPDFCRRDKTKARQAVEELQDHPRLRLRVSITDACMLFGEFDEHSLGVANRGNPRNPTHGSP